MSCRQRRLRRRQQRRRRGYDRHGHGSVGLAAPGSLGRQRGARGVGSIVTVTNDSYDFYISDDNYID